MFKKVPAPPFPVTINVVAPGGQEVGKLNLTCRAMRRSEFDGLMKSDAEVSDVMGRIITAWDHEDPLSLEAIVNLLDEYPATAREFMRVYASQMFELPRKNS